MISKLGLFSFSQRTQKSHAVELIHRLPDLNLRPSLTSEPSFHPGPQTLVFGISPSHLAQQGTDTPTLSAQAQAGLPWLVWSSVPFCCLQQSLTPTSASSSLPPAPHRQPFRSPAISLAKTCLLPDPAAPSPLPAPCCLLPTDPQVERIPFSPLPSLICSAPLSHQQRLIDPPHSAVVLGPRIRHAVCPCQFTPSQGGPGGSKANHSSMGLGQ